MFHIVKDRTKHQHVCRILCSINPELAWTGNSTVFLYEMGTNNINTVTFTTRPPYQTFYSKWNNYLQLEKHRAQYK
jgi:hypothetical protein